MESKEFIKYRYLGDITNIQIPRPWVPHVLIMLENIDKEVRPRYLPIWFLNIIFSSKNSKLHSIFRRLIQNTEIFNIKQKFATLRVYGNFTKKSEEIITIAEHACENTCEFCGSPNPTYTTVKGWVRLLCRGCITYIKG